MSAQYRPYRDEEGSDGLDNERLNWSDHEPGSIQIYEKTTEDLPFHGSRRTLFGVIGVALLCILCGFLIGFFSHGKHSDCVPTMSVALHAVKEADPNIRSQILENVNAESLRSVVREFSREARIPGSPNDIELAKQVADFFHAHSFDKVEVKNYSVLLSLPDENAPNYVEIIELSSPKRVIYTTLPSFVENDAKGFTSPYSAYSPDADVTTDVVFVNFGQATDYQQLHALNISLKGKILIAKQLQLHADEQVLNAQEAEAAGLILYPADTGQSDEWEGEESQSQVPRDAVRRDSLLWNGLGDPQTPSYPSTPYAFRLPVQAIKVFPKIPVQPISTEDAYEILGLMGGRRAPEKWGGAFNFTYHLGPGFQNKSLKVHLRVKNKLVNRTIQNVIGYIKGRVEPDRYVIIGNHRDSWVKGAIDAASGSATLLELSKVFGDLLHGGWRPRRTLMFCSWGAEEFNLMGSTEWLEENIKKIQARAVAYINTDIIAVGNVSLSVAASPLLYQAVFNATKQVADPENPNSSVYDKWTHSFPFKRNSSDTLFANKRLHASHSVDATDELYDYDNEATLSKNVQDMPAVDYTEPVAGSLLSNYINSVMVHTRPRVRQLDMRSAYAPFFTFAGIPAIEMTYVPAPKDAQSASSTYPLIHTQYDTMDLIDKFDKEFKYHRAVTQAVGEVVRNLADSLFLPFNLLDYAQVLRDLYVSLHLHSSVVFTANGIDFAWLDSAVHNFTEAALKFHAEQDKLDMRDPMAIRRVNDQLLLLERAFLDPNGLPRNPQKRHVVLSPSETGAPYEDFFPGLLDEFALLVHTDFNNPLWSWDMIKAHYSILVFTIQSAADVISDVV